MAESWSLPELSVVQQLQKQLCKAPEKCFKAKELDKFPVICYDIFNALKGISNRSFFQQRIAGRCEATGNPDEIHLGAVLLNC